MIWISLSSTRKPFFAMAPPTLLALEPTTSLRCKSGPTCSSKVEDTSLAGAALARTAPGRRGLCFHGQCALSGSSVASRTSPSNGGPTGFGSQDVRDARPISPARTTREANPLEDRLAPARLEGVSRKERALGRRRLPCRRALGRREGDGAVLQQGPDEVMHLVDRRASIGEVAEDDGARGAGANE